MSLSLVFYLTGLVVCLFSGLMLIPLGIDFLSQNIGGVQSFGISAVLSFCAGLLTCLYAKRQWTTIRPKEMFLSTSLVWFCAAFFSALPFYFYGFSFTDSFFESASGLSSTGATIFDNVELLSKGLLFWRALTQWIGGIGIIILAIAILPVLRIGGMQFFATENSDNSGKGAPMVAQKMKLILAVYGFFSLACALMLLIAGMTPFDAVCHMMTTVSTGGFSTHNDSVAFFKNPAVHYIIAFFMFVCSLPLVLTITLCKGDFKALKENTQLKTFVILLTLLIGGLTVYLKQNQHIPWEEAFRKTSFQTISLISTTGFVIDDFLLWGTFFVAVFFFITPIGGCTGSTAGGFKTFRLSVLFKTLKRHIQIMLTPHAVVVPKYDNRPLNEEVMISVLTFLTISLMIMTVSTLLLSFSGLDLFTALSASLSCMANVGPTTSAKICPFCSYGDIPSLGKWTLSCVMILGRLEFMTLIILLVPRFWRRT